MLGKVRKAGILIPIVAVFALAFAIACQSDPEIVEVEKIVTQEVIKEVQVPGETVVVEKEVVREVQVPGETVVVEKEVVKEVQVPGETVVVEKEVVKEVEVVREVEIQLVVTPTAVILAMPATVNAPAPTGDAGVITIAIADVPPGVGLGSTQLADGFHYWGVGEATFKATNESVVSPMLATDWELKLDDTGRPSGAILTIRDDVIFHGQGLDWAGGNSWGAMTAADVAFTINDGNNTLNNASIHWQAGDLAAMFGPNPAVAVDDTTLDLTFNTNAEGVPLFDPRWNANLLNDAGQAFSVQSLNRFDTVGKTEMQDNPLIGTGPYHIIEWIQDDIGIVESVPYDHWSLNSKVDRLIFREVPEENTQLALMETGEIGRRAYQPQEHSAYARRWIPDPGQRAGQPQDSGLLGQPVGD